MQTMASRVAEPPWAHSKLAASLLSPNQWDSLSRAADEHSLPVSGETVSPLECQRRRYQANARRRLQASILMQPVPGVHEPKPFHSNFGTPALISSLMTSPPQHLRKSLSVDIADLTNNLANLVDKKLSDSPVEGHMSEVDFASQCTPSSPSVGQLTSVSAFLSITSALLGTGLSVPYAFSEVGILPGAISLCIVALIVAYGVRMVSLSLSSDKCVELALLDGHDLRECELGFLAYCAFGNHGQIFTSLVLSLELWFALVVGLVSIGINGSLLTRGFLSQGVVICMSTAVIFPVLDAPAWLLGFGGVCSLLGTCLCAAGFFDAAFEAWPSATFESSVPVDPASTTFLSFISATGILVYSYGNAACLPPIRNEMASRTKFPLVSTSALLVSVLFYAAMGASAMPFGEATGQSYLQNVKRPAVLTVACLSIMVSFMFVMPLMTNPILLALLPLVRATTPAQILAFKAIFLVVSAGAAVFLQDYLAALSSLTGTSLTMLTIVILPAAIYVQLIPNVSKMEKLLLMIIGVLSVAFAVLGTYLAALDIMQGSLAA